MHPKDSNKDCTPKFFFGATTVVSIGPGYQTVVSISVITAVLIDVKISSTLCSF
ncbi:MAG: hypothetical protein Ct9H90mP15_07580 [Candidatus Neomarinimicrobiota bacterium]|nr:MAG: hypothetical protein Ct9H90mP15_07580 [Candidatus Neomarinimicrobiota bacterium]